VRKLADWTLLAALTVAGGWALGRAGLPSGYLYAALVAALGYALIARRPRLALPTPWFRAAQAVTGVALGTFLHASTFSDLGDRWLPVALVSAATLAVTIGAGVLLARITRLDRATASLGMVAGGASGIVAMAGDLDADEQLVSFMQYLRVLIVTLIAPLLVPLAFGIHPHGTAGGDGPLLGTPGGWALAAGAGLAGTALGPFLRLPAPALLGPLVFTAALSVAGLTGHAEVPPLARETAFSLIGIQIGLGFERRTLREIARVAAPVAATMATLLAACFALGWVLKLTAGVSLLDGYLATTPGGIPAVLPIAFGSGGDIAFVLAVQVLRVFVMVLAAPLLVRRIVRDESKPRHPPRPTRSEPLRQGPDYETMAEVEEHDVDDMLDGIAERRRRRGGRDLGEELADELIRGTWEERGG
jgi:membrane AbrB-like protein